MHAPTITSPRQAAAALADGRLVVLPTETVYGLGALASIPAAVERVFATKGRPADHPLIVHIGSADAVGLWAAAAPSWLGSVLARCWPGPLTVVLPASDIVSPLVTGGQPTVALRVPAHPLAAAVLDRLGPAAGIVAPSANLYGQVSPTSAQAAWDSLGHRLRPGDLILDGGECSVGVESTIVDCTGTAPRILRPGAIGASAISALAGVECEDHGAVDASAGVPRVPGSHASHYAPHATVLVVPESEIAAAGGLAEALRGASDAAARPGTPGTLGEPGDWGLIAPAAVATPPGWTRLLAATSDRAYAHDLYAALRAGDDSGCRMIVAVPPSGGSDLAAAVRDRLTRAAAGNGILPGVAP